VPWLPTPIIPIVIRFDGAPAPSTRAGTRAGNPSTAATPPDRRKNPRLVVFMASSEAGADRTAST
jgi:hypothetical protein